MKRETQSKAIAAAIAGLFVSVGPILINIVSGLDVTPDQLSTAREALNVLMLAVGGTAFAWATVWFAPRNKPIE